MRRSSVDDNLYNVIFLDNSKKELIEPDITYSCVFGGMENEEVADDDRAFTGSDGEEKFISRNILSIENWD